MSIKVNESQSRIVYNRLQVQHLIHTTKIEEMQKYILFVSGNIK